MALQAYVMIRKVKNNVPVRLKRSAIPIVSGELLESSSSIWTFNWFVLVNFVSIVIAFAISMGINGETIQTNVPIIDQKRSETDNRRYALAQPTVTTCKRVEKESVKYYPVAFNITYKALLDDLVNFLTKKGSQRIINASTGKCQWGAAPVLSITNCSRCSNYLRADQVESKIIFFNEIESERLAGTGNLTEWFHTRDY